MDITVEGIRFIAEDKAQVSFALLFPAEPLPRLSESGTAVVIDGQWKVARQTYCKLVQSLGIECPPSSHNPVGPRSARANPPPPRPAE